MENITVVGAGSWGLALGLLLNAQGHNVTFWCYSEEEKEEILQHRENKRCLPGIKIPLEINFTIDMKESLKKADVVVLAVPSKGVRTTALNMKPYLKKQAIVVNVAKGVEEESLLRLSEVIEEVIPNPIVVLSGPSHAEEVARHIPTAVTVSSKNLDHAYKIQDLMMTKYFRVYTNSDIIGIEIGGALKNVIALATGIIDGMGFGDNTKAALMTRGIAEMTRLGIKMGGQASTFAGLTGIGDLIVTCTSGHSRNRRAGELIGQGYTMEEAIKKVNMVVEGVPTTKACYDLMKKHDVDMPILEAIYSVIFENKPAKETIYNLMMRDKKHEN